MIERCDHPRQKASLSSFMATTKMVGIQDDGAGGFLLLRKCLRCDSTLAVQIDLVRGHVVAGTIETAERECDEDPPF